jgi:hypothetical protein
MKRPPGTHGDAEMTVTHNDRSKSDLLDFIRGVS